AAQARCRHSWSSAEAIERSSEAIERSSEAISGSSHGHLSSALVQTCFDPLSDRDGRGETLFGTFGHRMLDDRIKRKDAGGQRGIELSEVGNGLVGVGRKEVCGTRAAERCLA